MHIPDAYLSPATEGVAYAVMIPLWSIAARKTSRSLSTKQAPLLSIGAAFCFAIQMFNIPAVGGTTAHALGSTPLAVLVGPWAALMGITLTLAIQALLFGDGGILSLAANCWDMGFVASFAGYWTYRLLSGQTHVGSGRSIVAAGIGAYVGTVTASLSAGILLGIQPLVAHDAAGHALYNPFGLNVAVPAMVMSHLLMAGPAEAIITIGAVAYLWKTFPEYASASVRPHIDSGVRMARKLAWIVVLTPIGLIAGGDAFGEWDLETLKKMVGYAPAGTAKAGSLIHPILPDYGFAGISSGPWQVAGYLLSALIGCALVAGFTRGVLRSSKAEPLQDLPPGKPSTDMPEWLRLPQAHVVCQATSTSKRKKWLANTLFRLRATVERTIASEAVARTRGLLQSIHPLAKALGFIAALVAVGLARTPAPLVALLLIGFGAAALSNIPLKPLVTRVTETTLFFGLIVAIPILFRSPADRTLALMILLRLAAGITLAVVWNLTTKWYELLTSLRSLGVPAPFLSMATLTYRYLFVIVETMAEMVEARTARQAGANTKGQARTYVGQGTAILFAKSQAFTEEMHQAMVSRNFQGVARTQRSKAWGLRDSMVTAMGFGVLVVVICLK